MLLGRAGHARAARRPRRRTAPTRSRPTRCMRGGVLQLHRWGLLDAIRRAGTPPIRRTRVPLRRPMWSTCRSEPSTGSTRCTRPRRTVLDRILVDAARDAGVDGVVRTARDGLVARPRRSDRGHPRSGRRRRGGRRRGTDRHRSRRCELHDRAAGRRADRAGNDDGERVRVRLLRGRRTRCLRLVLPAGRERGRHPDERQRREHLCRVATVPFPLRLAPLRRRDGVPGGTARGVTRRGPITLRHRAYRPVPQLPGLARPLEARATGRAGRSSATPATSRTRSPPTASPTRSATPSSWRAHSSRRGTRARYQRDRDVFARPFLTLTARTAAYDWDLRRDRRAPPADEDDDRRRSGDARRTRRGRAQRSLISQPRGHQLSSATTPRTATSDCERWSSAAAPANASSKVPATHESGTRGWT